MRQPLNQTPTEDESMPYNLIRLGLDESTPTNHCSPFSLFVDDLFITGNYSAETRPADIYSQKI